MTSTELFDHDFNLQAILDNSSAVIFIKDLEGRHMFVNSQFATVLGKTKEHVIGKTTAELFPEEHGSALTADDRLVIESNTPQHKEEVIPSANGIRYFQTVKFALYDKNKKPWAVCGICTDITSQKLSASILHASEEKFRHLFELSPIAIAQWETDGYLVEANHVFLDLLGIVDSDILNIQYRDITTSNKFDNSITELLQLADNSSLASIETSYLQKSGDEIPVEVYAVKVMSKRGNEQIWSMLIDLRASKLAEKEIENKRTSFEAIFRKNPEPLFITEVEGGIVIDANDAFLATSGYKYDEVIGISTLNLKLWKYPEDRQRMLEELHKNGSVKDMEIEGLTLAGDTRIFNIASDMIMVDGKKVLLTSAEDVTEKRHYEAALTRIASALAYDPEEDLLDKITRYFADTMKTDVAFIGRLNESGEPRMISTINVIKNGKKADNFEYDLTHSPCEQVFGNGQCIYPENVQQLFPEDIMLQKRGIEAYLGSPLVDSSGRNIGIIVGLYKNKIDKAAMTSKLLAIFSRVAAGEIERLKAYDEQLELQKRLQEKQKMELVGRISGGIAHDFNNILASILGYSDLATLLTGEKDGKLNRFLGEINKAGKRARDLVEKLLIFSRRDSGAPENIKVDSVIAETMDMLAPTTPATIQTNCKCTVKDGLNYVYADPVQLQQVMINLLINARDAIKDSGTITIATSLEDMTGAHTCASCDDVIEGSYVKISVADSGEGIPADIGGGIFSPFYSTRKQGEFSGLGLSVVHGIVHSHGGHITVSSNENRGTEICIFIPPGTAQPLEEARNIPLASQENCNTGDSLGNRILVVDDEEALLGLFQSMLEDHGYEVIATSDSADAIEIIQDQSKSLSLVITDQVMPGMSGIQIAKIARDSRPGLPVFLCSGFSDLMDDTPKEDVYFDASFTKPIDSMALLRKIKETIPGQTLSH